MGSVLESPVSITLLLIAVNVAVSLVGFYALSRDRYRKYFVFVPSRAGENWVGTILSHVSHGDFGHLLLNMIALFIFGPDVERELGPLKYLAVYALSGALATLTIYLIRRNNPRYGALGASGSIAGIMFAAVVIAPTSSIFLFFLPIRVPAPIFAVLYLVFSSIHMGGRDGVAHEAHIGGAVAGFALTGILFDQHFEPFVRAVTELAS